MEAERWQTIERLYHSALEREQNQRAAFLEQACGGDDSLRSEVESLLAQGEENGSFLETPALEVAAKALAQNRAGAAVYRADRSNDRRHDLASARPGRG